VHFEKIWCWLLSVEISSWKRTIMWRLALIIFSLDLSHLTHKFTMVNHPSLSLEVVERIIDIAAEHDIDLSSIKACALASHSFLPRCRYHIFASVTLNARVARRALSPTSDDFNHLLSNSPHLAVYVRDLDYYFNKREFVAKRLPWLLSMFKKLVKLQELRITYSPTTPTRRHDWMSSSERKILLPLLHLPTLTSISLSTIGNFALADLAGCVNLKELRIESIEFSTGVGSFLEALPVTPVMLERLVIQQGNVRPLQRLCNVPTRRVRVRVRLPSRTRGPIKSKNAFHYPWIIFLLKLRNILCKGGMLTLLQEEHKAV
jgi:hypothetical protein